MKKWFVLLFGICVETNEGDLVVLHSGKNGLKGVDCLGNMEANMIV